MLPFMKDKQVGSASLPVESVSREPDDGEYDALHSAAEDLLQAIETKNVKLLAEALRAAFELCDSEPHTEGPHTNG